MLRGKRIGLIIPALNEAEALQLLLPRIPSFVDRTLVCDNGSEDATARVAQSLGAEVVHEARKGYGAACLKALNALRQSSPPDIVVFLDADAGNAPEDMAKLLSPNLEDDADFSLASRVLGTAEAGALTPVQRFGNHLACWLIRLFWKVKMTDLGPFRALTWSALERLNMQDRDFGWTVEMQIKAARLGLNYREVALDSFARKAGKSKVSGTLSGSFKAGSKILYILFRSLFEGSEKRR